jgi:hypothetical protein
MFMPIIKLQRSSFIYLGFIGLNKRDDSSTSSRRTKQKPKAKKAKFIPDPDKEGIMVSHPFRGAPKAVKNAIRILKNSSSRGSLLLRNVRAQYCIPPRRKQLEDILEDLQLDNFDNLSTKTVLLTFNGSFPLASKKRIAPRSELLLANQSYRSFLTRNFNPVKKVRRKTLKEIFSKQREELSPHYFSEIDL